MSVLDKNRTFIFFKKQNMFRSPCYTQPLGKEVYGLESKISIPRLKLRQKQIDALLAHDITKLYCTKPGGCILLFSRDTDFVPRSRLGKRL
ncbi:hypothetical protein HpSLK40_06110 [Helicobacter pylori]